VKERKVDMDFVQMNRPGVKRRIDDQRLRRDRKILIELKALATRHRSMLIELRTFMTRSWLIDGNIGQRFQGRCKKGRK